MTEAEATEWLSQRGWWQSASGDRLRLLAEMVRAENDRQNLVARSTLDAMWARHIVDSAQLVSLAGQHMANPTCWLDIGSGAGFPGLVVACLADWPTTLVEPRPLRTAFLAKAAEALDLGHVTVVTGRVERLVSQPYDIISARAFAALPTILRSAHHLAAKDTLWLLPKGRQAEKELATAEVEWQGVFHVEQSVTDPAGKVILASSVAPRNCNTGRNRAVEGRKRQKGR